MTASPDRQQRAVRVRPGFRIVAAALVGAAALAGCSSSGTAGTSSSPTGLAGSAITEPATSASATSASATSASATQAATTTPGPASSAASAGSFAGGWAGTYTSQKFTSTQGSFTVTFAQHGRTISGTIDITPSCIPHATVSGTTTGSTISFGQVRGTTRTVQFDGTISGDRMHGTYHSDASCGSDKGIWQAARA